MTLIWDCNSNRILWNVGYATGSNSIRILCLLLLQNRVIVKRCKFVWLLVLVLLLAHLIVRKKKVKNQSAFVVRTILVKSAMIVSKGFTRMRKGIALLETTALKVEVQKIAMGMVTALTSMEEQSVIAKRALQTTDLSFVEDVQIHCLIIPMSANWCRGSTPSYKTTMNVARCPTRCLASYMMILNQTRLEFIKLKRMAMLHLNRLLFTNKKAYSNGKADIL